MKVILDVKNRSDLKWENEKKLASLEPNVEWCFDLGVQEKGFSLEDPLVFESISLGLKTFTQEVFPLFKDKTNKIVLYEGSIDFSSHFPWSERQEKNFEEWKKEAPSGSVEHQERRFSLLAFSHYFQMLSYHLPEEMPLTLRFFRIDTSKAQEEDLFSRERFEHFLIERFPEVVKYNRAIVFPEIAKCSQEILDRLDALFVAEGKPFHVIHEPFLTEEWQGVDTLMILKELVSERVERKLKGFEATGGEIIYK